MIQVDKCPKCGHEQSAVFIDELSLHGIGEKGPNDCLVLSLKIDIVCPKCEARGHTSNVYHIHAVDCPAHEAGEGVADDDGGKHVH